PLYIPRVGRWMLIQGGPKFDELSLVPLNELKPAGPERKVANGRALLSSFSPDGRWIVHGAPESGRLEIVVVPTEGGEGRWQISTAGGAVPIWSPRGDEIFYLEGEELMAGPPAAAHGFGARTPHELFSKP